MSTETEELPGAKPATVTPRPGFSPQPMVRWLSPRFLVGAGIEVLLSGLFARFADKREVEAWASISEPPPEDDFGTERLWAEDGPYTRAELRDENGDLWFDFVSDVGEGFDPTYTIAWLLAQPDLTLVRDRTEHRTGRGRFLVCGGDQVYPAASWDNYRDRFVGPYRAALPSVEPKREAPDIWAIPGNHDWYDGLTSFLRVFCQGGWVGGWRTRQTRSYFALRLSERWWLWGTDTQFDSYLDGPQLDYFRAARAKLGKGHRVILATAKPSWVNVERPASERIMEAGSWETLSFVEEELIASTGAEVAVTITGDKHHYARYVRQGADGEGPRERITAGGGGAHTSATHDLRPEIPLRPHGSESEVTYALRGVSPEPAESLEMRSCAIRGLRREHALGATIGGLYALIAILVADAIKDGEPNLAVALDPSFGHALLDAVSLWTVGLIALLGLGLYGFADGEQKQKRARFGAAHAAAHVIPLLVVTFAILWLLRNSGVAEDGMLLGWIAAAVAFALGFTFGRVVFGGYLLFSNRDDPRQHATEIYGGLASTEHKNFLRFRLSADGELTVYPVGVRTSPHWRLDPAGSGRTGSWYAPDTDPEPRLLDDPIPL